MCTLHLFFSLVLICSSFAQICSNYGGSYQTNNVDNQLNVVNAETGTNNCPNNYNSRQTGKVLDPRNNASATQFACVSTGNTNCLSYRYGGTFMTPTDPLCIAGYDSNPITGLTNCPPNYTPVLIGYAYKNGCPVQKFSCKSSNATRYWRFGGSYQVAGALCQSSNDQVQNAVSGGFTCPSHYVALKAAAVWAPNDNCIHNQYICVAEDEDECLSGMASCVQGATCQNVIGTSFTCSCASPPCYQGISSSLPLVILSTQGSQLNDVTQTISDMIVIKDPTSNINVLTNQTPRNFSGVAAVKISGAIDNPKPDYSVELRDPADTSQNLNSEILGLPSENDFILLGLGDPTKIRQYLTWKLNKDQGSWSPRSVYVELFVIETSVNLQSFNFERLMSVPVYKGIYLLAEKVKRDKNRIDIVKLDNTTNSLPEVTGGYIAYVDKPGVNDIVIVPEGNRSVIIDTPKTPTVTQKNYLTQIFQTLDTTLQSVNFANPLTGYPSKIFARSFIDYFLISEFSKNPNSYKSKAYLYKDREPNGRIYSGPIWDASSAWARSPSFQGNITSGWIYQEISSSIPFWWARLLQDQNYACRLVQRWQNLRSSVFNTTTVLQRIANLTNLISDSLPRDNWRFPAYDPNAWTFSEEVSYMSQFVQDRGMWMDANVNSFVNGQCQFSTTTVFPTEIRSVSPEFLEMKNTGNANVDLNGWSMGGDITFYFSQLTMNPRSFVVVTQNRTLFNARFPPNSRGDYIGKLTSKGTISLLDYYGTEVWTVKYDTVSPWPVVGTTDRSMVTITPNPTSAFNDPSQWRLSTNLGGSPGSDDVSTISTGAQSGTQSGTQSSSSSSGGGGTQTSAQVTSTSDNQQESKAFTISPAILLVFIVLAFVL